MTTTTRARLDYLRTQIEDECVSWGELLELQGLADKIDPSDILLLEWAGVSEGSLDMLRHKGHDLTYSERGTQDWDVSVNADGSITLIAATEFFADDYTQSVFCDTCNEEISEWEVG